MAEYRSIKVERGPGGFGGPLVITPTEKRNKVCLLYTSPSPRDA